jgi:hypothetical protein
LVTEDVEEIKINDELTVKECDNFTMSEIVAFGKNFLNDL